jgi:4-oxalocrotonate tautomerase
MPVVQITIVEGRSTEDVENCIRNVAQAVHESLKAPIESVRVMVYEVPPNRFSVGQKLKSD